MSKPKILIIPSWYPSNTAPFVGSFFRDQAILVSDDYDIKVLYGQAELVGKKNILKKLLSLSIDLKLSVNVHHDYLAPPEGIFFNFEMYAFLSKHNQIYYAQTVYLKMLLQHIAETGWKPDLIHAHDVFNAGCIALYISEKINIPFIVTQHSPILFHTLSNNMQSIFRSVLEKAPYALAVSNADVRNTLILNIDYKPCVVGNLIDETIYTIDPTTLISSGKFRVFYLGTYSKRKDIPTFLKAIKFIAEKGIKDIEFVLQLSEHFSDGITKEEVNLLIDQMEISNFCQVRNNMTLTEKIKFLQHSNLFVSTSYYETFGVAICEAMACGTPVVAVKNGGIEDIITSSNGILVSIMDSEEVATEILKVYNKEIIFSPEEIRASVINKFGKEAFRNKLLSVYKEIITTESND